ncbi:uncharacterized protein METZ01_LOCUS309520 [marine metagenome]|uniref:Uncharacterized protein n=1 Tax=marine metagenome TaxID=408172 RepID=A0A382N6G7_9ZZZZ
MDIERFIKLNPPISFFEGWTDYVWLISGLAGIAAALCMVFRKIRPTNTDKKNWIVAFLLSGIMVSIIKLSFWVFLHEPHNRQIQDKIDKLLIIELEAMETEKEAEKKKE